jgi:protocatechuate 3,4-dioxygenase beta subunit
MDNDDEQVGRLLGRREALAVLGLSGVALLTTGIASRGGVAAGALHQGFGIGLPSCVVRPEQTEGPFFVDRMLERVDIRSDPASGRISEGLPIDLGINVSRVGSDGCSPLSGAQVDLWQCDARGEYSGVNERDSNARQGLFLRGYQRTDAAGRAQFTTIYPGWYRGRAVHIHFKIRTDPEVERGQEFVSQLYFDDALTDRVHATPPYADRGQRDRRNAADGIFRRGGEQLMLTLAERAGGGYQATFEIGLQI